MFWALAALLTREHNLTVEDSLVLALVGSPTLAGLHTDVGTLFTCTS